MADGISVFKGSAARGDGARFVADETEFSAVGTGLMAAQGSGLLCRGGLKGAGHQPTHGSHGHVFHSVQIHIRSRPLISEGLLADDFSPAVCEVVNSVKVLLVECSLRHLVSLLEVALIAKDELPLSMLGKRLAAAKQVLHPFCNQDFLLTWEKAWPPVMMGVVQTPS